MFLHSVTDNENNFADAPGIVEFLPRVRDDGATGNLKPQFVHARTHTNAFAGGYENGSVHL
jgi:hypothetical protein